MRMRMMGNRNGRQNGESGWQDQTYNPQSNSYSADRRRNGYQGRGMDEMRTGREPMRKNGHRPEWEDDDWEEDDGWKRREKEKEGRKRKPIKAGGTFWMDEGDDDDETLDRETAERWVKSMKGEDSKGGKWTMEELKPVAQKNGVPTEGEKFVEFYAMMNAMYSDYSEVAKKFNINTPDFFACLTKAWMNDKDAVENKTAKYYEEIVKK